MLRKVITYENPFSQQQVTEEHFFHISKADLVEMQLEEHGTTYDKDGETLTGMQAKMQRIMDAEDGKAIIAEIKDLIRRSYGKKDGDRFVKTQAFWDDFSSSEAFSQLLFELCTDATEASAFVSGVVPHNLDQIAAEIEAKAEQSRAETPAAVTSEEPSAVDPTGLTNAVTPRVLTQQEVVEMDRDDLKAGLADGRYKLS